MGSEANVFLSKVIYITNLNMNNVERVKSIVIQSVKTQEIRRNAMKSVKKVVGAVELGIIHKR